MPREANLFKRFFSSRWFIICGILVLGFLLFAMVRAAYQDYQIKEEIKSLQDEAQKLEAKKLEMLDLLSYVKSPDYVEEKARKELNLAKEGEKVAVILNGGQKSGQEQEKVIKFKDISNPLKWWNYFFK